MIDFCRRRLPAAPSLVAPAASAWLVATPLRGQSAYDGALSLAGYLALAPDAHAFAVAVDNAGWLRAVGAARPVPVKATAVNRRHWGGLRRGTRTWNRPVRPFAATGQAC